MQQQAPRFTTLKRIQNEAVAKEHRKLRTKGRMKAARAFKYSEHRYELKIGDSKTGILRTMLGREAKTLNQQAVLDFGSQKKKRLSMWVWRKDLETSIDE